MFTNKRTQGGSNSIIDNIKAEPKTKKILFASKICQIMLKVLLVLFFIVAAYELFFGGNSGDSNKGTFYNFFSSYWVILVICLYFACMIVDSILQTIVYFIIDKRLTKMATEKGVQDKFPTGKDVTKWKILCQFCGAGMLIFIIIAFVIYKLNHIAAIVMFVGMFLPAFLAYLTNKKAENLQAQRVNNITFADPPMQNEQDDVFADKENCN